MENKPFNYNPISINLQAKESGLQCKPINYLFQTCSQLSSSGLYVQLGFNLQDIHNFLSHIDTLAQNSAALKVKDNQNVEKGNLYYIINK